MNKEQRRPGMRRRRRPSSSNAVAKFQKQKRDTFRHPIASSTPRFEILKIGQAIRNWKKKRKNRATTDRFGGLDVGGRAGVATLTTCSEPLLDARRPDDDEGAAACCVSDWLRIVVAECRSARARER